MSNADTMAAWAPTLGAWRDADGTRFRVWAPDHASVELVLERADAGFEANDVRSRAGGISGGVRPAHELTRIDDQRIGAPYNAQAIGGVMVSSAAGSGTREVRTLTRDDHGYWSARFGDV